MTGQSRLRYTQPPGEIFLGQAAGPPRRGYGLTQAHRCPAADESVSSKGSFTWGRAGRDGPLMSTTSREDTDSSSSMSQITLFAPSRVFTSVRLWSTYPDSVDTSTPLSPHSPLSPEEHISSPLSGKPAVESLNTCEVGSRMVDT